MDELLEKFIFHIGGEMCVKLAKELEKLGDVEITDQELAEKLGEDINTTRKNLYKLLDYNLAEYRRTRDKKNGWIIFYFKSNFSGYQKLIVERNQAQIDKWKKLLEYEENNMFYSCAAGCTRKPFAEAADMDFRCPQCEQILNFKDNSKKIEELKNKIKRAEEDNKKILATITPRVKSRRSKKKK